MIRCMRYLYMNVKYDVGSVVRKLNTSVYVLSVKHAYVLIKYFKNPSL